MWCFIGPSACLEGEHEQGSCKSTSRRWMSTNCVMGTMSNWVVDLTHFCGAHWKARGKNELWTLLTFRSAANCFSLLDRLNTFVVLPWPNAAIRPVAHSVLSKVPVALKAQIQRLPCKHLAPTKLDMFLRSLRVDSKLHHKNKMSWSCFGPCNSTTEW